MTTTSGSRTLGVDYLVCPVCKREMRALTTQHIRKHGFESALVFKKAFGLDSLRCSAIRDAQSKFMQKNNPTAGGHRPATIEKMRQNRKGKGIGVAGKYERTPAIRRKIAEGVIASWETGKRGRGSYVFSRKCRKKVWVRSTWEARVVRVLDLHPCVLSYGIEPLRIPYEFEGVGRLYVPDFLVELEGGIFEVWEIKPKELINWPRNAAKMRALNAFVEKKGFNARLVILEQIEGMEMQVGIRPWEGRGEPWVKLDDPTHRPGMKRGVSNRSHSRSRSTGEPDDG